MTIGTRLVGLGLIVALVALAAAAVAQIPREIGQHEVSAQNAAVYLRAGESVEQEFRLVGSGFRYVEAQANWTTTADARRQPVLRLYRCGTDDAPLRGINANVVPNEWLSVVRLDLPSPDSAGPAEPCLRLQISAPLSASGEMRVGETLNLARIAGSYLVNGSPVEGRTLWLVIGRRWSVTETLSQMAPSLTLRRAGAVTLGAALLSVLAVVLQVNWALRRYALLGNRVSGPGRLLLIVVMLFSGSLVAVSLTHDPTPLEWRSTFLQGFVVAPASLALIAFAVWLSATGAPGLRSGGQRRSARAIWFDPGVWVIAAFNVAVLGVFLLVLWQRLGDAERIAQLGYILLGTFFALEIVDAVSLRIRDLWTRRAG